MRPQLFFTGEIGCGKSTVLRTALGDALSRCGGFLTLRTRDPQGNPRFSLRAADGSREAVFLDCTREPAQVSLDVFRETGIPLLTGNVLVLDEIGGLELLCPEFCRALNDLLDSGTPILGVVKGPGPASSMIRRLGLSEDYEAAADALRKKIAEGENSRLYLCGQYDPQALALAREWVKEYLHD